MRAFKLPVVSSEEERAPVDLLAKNTLRTYAPSPVFNTDVLIVLVSCSVKQQPYKHIRSGTVDDVIDDVIIDSISKLVQ